jgi:manganese/zinc/iron transport system substrate-binding protein
MEAWMTPNGKLKVLSTTAMIDDLVKRIGADQIDHQVLIRGNLDPHSYQLVKGDDEKLSVATLIFYNGLGLEHGASLQRYLQTDQKGIPLGNLIASAHPELILTVNGQTDPHIWMDVSLWSRTVPLIVQELSKRDPAHADLFQKNGEILLQELQQTDRQVRETLHAIPAAKRFLVTSHDAFNYFARAYMAADDEVTMDQWEKRFAAPEGLAPESQLSATDIKNMMNHLRQYQITVLFPESNVSKDSIKKIVDAGQKEGLTLKIASPPLYADAMGAPGSDGDSYVKMILHNATTISENLK